MSDMLAKIVAAFAAGQRFLLTSHEGPDGDAIGATLGLANHLRAQGKVVTVYLQDPVPEQYAFLPLADQVVHTLPAASFDVTVVLDIGSARRAGTAFGAFPGKGVVVNLDHHLLCEEFGDLNLIDPKASATGALVYRLIVAAGQELAYPAALCLYVAIITDTGSFRYSNADPEAFAIAGELIARGVNAWDVAEQLYESQPRQRMELLARALTTLTFSPRGDYASLTVTTEMYAATGATAEHTDGFVNYPRAIRGVEVSVFFRQLGEASWKVGFRSKGKVNVAEISAALGGGGHRNAAGATIEGELAAVQAQVFAALEQALA